MALDTDPPAPDVPASLGTGKGSGRGRTALWVAISLGLVFALFVGVLATRKSAESRLTDSPLLGRPARDLAGPGVDGGHVDLTDYRGKWVVVNFFATWCVPCQEEHPELLAFQKIHHDAGDGQVLAVVWQDTPAAVRQYFRDKGGDWPVINDPSGTIALTWGVRGPPESYVVDPNGVVVAKFTGAVTVRGLESVLAHGPARPAGRS